MDPDHSPGTFRYELAPDESVIEGVIRATASVTNRDPTDLDVLHAVLDPDALEALFNSADDRSLAVTFTYSGFDVHITNDGTIRLHPTADEGTDFTQPR